MDITLEGTDFDFDAGKLCLDFANTSDWHASPTPRETLNTYHDLVLWGWAANLLSESEAQDLWVAAGQRPQAAEQVYARAIALREALYRIFSGSAGGQSPQREDLEVINAALRNAMPHLQLSEAKRGFALHWENSTESLDRMIWPVVQSTLELLSSDDLDRVGECADDRGCGYLFYDTSRNKSRRWCSMESCGNRAKAMRHYERRQED